MCSSIISQLFTFSSTESVWISRECMRLVVWARALSFTERKLSRCFLIPPLPENACFQHSSHTKGESLSTCDSSPCLLVQKCHCVLLPMFKGRRNLPKVVHLLVFRIKFSFSCYSTYYMAVSTLIYVLVVIFGSSTWIGTNSVWMQLSLFTSELPEGWNLPSYLTVVVQVREIVVIADPAAFLSMLFLICITSIMVITLFLDDACFCASNFPLPQPYFDRDGYTLLKWKSCENSFSELGPPKVVILWILPLEGKGNQWIVVIQLSHFRLVHEKRHFQYSLSASIIISEDSLVERPVIYFS